MSKQDTVMMCLSVSNNPRPIIKSCTKRECTECIQEVWIAPTSIELLKQHPDARVLCEECFLVLARRQTFHVPMPNEAQREEMRESGFEWPYGSVDA